MALKEGAEVLGVGGLEVGEEGVVEESVYRWAFHLEGWLCIGCGVCRCWMYFTLYQCNEFVWSK